MVHDRKRCPEIGREAEAASGTSSEPAGHNEGEPYLMSIEKKTTGKPKPSLRAEGCQEQTEQPLQSAQRSGGVGGGWHAGKGSQGNPGDLFAARI